MNNKLIDKNNISYYILDNNAEVLAAEVIANAFQFWFNYMLDFFPECSNNKCSVIAFDSNANLPIGAVISRDFYSTINTNIDQRFSHCKPMLAILNQLDNNYIKLKGEIKPYQIMDLWLGGVIPNEEYMKRGIAKEMSRLAINLIKNQKYMYCVAECTGYYSQKIMQSVGFSEITKIKYRDFKYNNTNIFSEIPQPHDYLIFYEILCK